MDEIEALKSELSETVTELVETLSLVTKAARLSALEKELAMREIMPCGHLAVFAFTNDAVPDDGSTWNCLMCLAEVHAND